MEKPFILKKGKEIRKSGHYWVQWAGKYSAIDIIWKKDIWRIGAYAQGIGWKLPGDDRLYYDTDFIKINPNRIPFTNGTLFVSTWYWVAVTANIVAGAISIYYILTHR